MSDDIHNRRFSDQFIHDKCESIIKQEVISVQVAEELKRIHSDTAKLNETYGNHLEQNNQSFTEVSKTLVEIAGALETTRSSISDLKDTTKTLSEVQNQMITKMNLIDGTNKSMESLHVEVSALKTKIDALEKIEAAAKGTWKTISVVATVIAFFVSTVISVGAFKIGQNSTPAVQQPASISLQVNKQSDEETRILRRLERK